MTSRAPAILMLLLPSVASLAGCHALYFYETGKISLTLEGKPDASEPVQGNLGFKQRTAVIMPEMKDGEAAAMISSFRFEKEPGFFGAVDVKTALVTGTAATELNEAESSRVAQAVAGTPIDSTDALAERSIATAKTNGREAELRTLAAKPWTALTEDEKRKLGAMTGVGAHNYFEALHNALRSKLGG